MDRALSNSGKLRSPPAACSASVESGDRTISRCLRNAAICCFGLRYLTIRLRKTDHHKAWSCSSAGLPHEVSKANSWCALQVHITNTVVHKCSALPHIGALIQARRHSLSGHVVRLPSDVPCHAILKLSRDISFESSDSGGLAEGQGASPHFMEKSAHEGYRGINCYILVTCGGSSDVEGGRYGPHRLLALDRERE